MRRSAARPAAVRLGRRALLAAFGGLSAAHAATPPSGAVSEPAPPFDTLELFAGSGRERRGSLVLVPRGTHSPESLPLLVLLHGLGETGDERAGMRAWLEPYGLGRALQRLAAPPLEHGRERYLSDAALAAHNASLRERPYAGLIVACPYLPNPHRDGSAVGALDRYAAWLEAALLPALRERLPSATRRRWSTGLGGVSLGGFAALEVFSRLPATFGTVATVQGAFGREHAKGYVRALAEAERPIAAYVATSSNDPYRDVNRGLGRALEEAGVPALLSVRPGPHSQGWLRAVGTFETLLWHDRALRGQAATGEPPS